MSRQSRATKPVSILLAGVLLTGAGAVAVAAGDDDAATAASPAAGQVLTRGELAARLAEQGYPKVLRMEMEDGVLEVKVRNAEGKRLSLNVDPHTGKVLGKHKDWLW